ncbi:MAG: hypothetical protein IPK80_12235 [Nannocystis sp.]|nr:hypothetical protein [Nannocystis sp.]
MDRQIPSTTSDEIDLYIRTYYSLLRSSGDVRVRALEEAHIYSNCSLHAGARGPNPDVAAFAYSAARLPSCMYKVQRIILGQAREYFEAEGHPIRTWETVRTRGRRRPLRFDGLDTLAAYISSTSDIDDLVPILTAYQIVWNQMHSFLAGTALGSRLAAGVAEDELELDPEVLATILGITSEDVHTLRSAFETTWIEAMREIARRPADLRLRLLNGSYSQYQRTAQRWWSGIEPVYVRTQRPRRPPVYIVSSNTHSVVNLLGGYARTHRQAILDFAHRTNREGLAPVLEAAFKRGDDAEISNLTYYLLRAFLHEDRGDSDPRRLEGIQRFEAEGGLQTIDVPGRVDVNAQLIELGRLRPERLDPRVRLPGIEALAGSDAVILNIDYPLGVAAYHHLSRLGQGVGEIRGVYIMGKAATLNGRIGDVMIPTVVHDEHSRNTYLFRNAFAAADVQPYFETGTVLDQQKALTVRGAFLQNREYMSVFYREGYTILEMEAGPYLSALYELVDPRRHPNDEVVHLTTMASFDVGILHYASDTPYSRRQSLLSKSLSFFGVESTYACAIAICRKIFANELALLGKGG